MIALLLAMALADVPGRPYHPVPLEQVATTRHTHVETCGQVVYRRKMADGDWHLTLARGRVKVVVEVIPAIPLTIPRKGATVTVKGITRIDRHHAWAEIHPAEAIQVVPSCR